MAKKETQKKEEIKLLDRVLIKIETKHIKSNVVLNCEVKATITALGLKVKDKPEDGIWYRVLIDNSSYPIEIDEKDIINKIENEA